MWSLSAEIPALILVVAIALFYYDKTQIRTAKRKFLEMALWLNMISILLNAVCVYSIDSRADFPYWLNMTLNSLYFLIVVWVGSLIAAYMFGMILEHVYSKICRRKAIIGISVLLTIYTIIVAANIWTGWLFSFDSEGGYHRGILNKFGYVILMLELCLVLICYVRNRASTDKKVKKVIYTLPPITLLMVVVQVMFPAVLLNGTIATVTIMIIFMSSQSFRTERDSLTGLGSRKSFYEEMVLRMQGRQQFQIIMISLIEFASVNQKFSYHKGDEFLYHISRWLENCTKEGRAFRFGNVTFALLCPYENEMESQKLLKCVKERFREPWKLGEIQKVIPACFGIMACVEPKWEATQVMELLTFMMENAKENDCEQIEFNEDVEQRFQKKKEMLVMLEDSLEKRRFEVWYQPIFNCGCQDFTHAEALIRLRDYEGNLVNPEEFISLAEENGLIEEIGRFVRKEVCRFFCKHPDICLEAITINMSMQEFRNPDLYREILSCLDDYQVTADKIKMEITERVLLYDEKYMKTLMHDFSAKGLMAGMDDFGIGYSNLSSLMHLPFGFVKFDRSLMSELSTNAKDRLLVKSMMELFHEMKMNIVAEGIETKEQRDTVCAMGVDYIQGFYYARPMPETEFVNFLKAH